jgi:hypothetical protein
MKDTWKVLPRPKGRKPLRNKNVYTWKQDQVTNEYTPRARNVIKGFSMVEGVDYTDSFSSQATDHSLRVVLTTSLSIFNDLAKSKGIEYAKANWTICDVYDVDAAFLNTPAVVDLYAEAPIWFEEFCKKENIKFDREKDCLLLGMTQYGQKDASRLFQTLFTEVLTDEEEADMTCMLSDPCVFAAHDEEGLSALSSVHVDDSTLSGNKKECERIKNCVRKKLAIKDLGPIKKHLGVNYALKDDEHGFYFELTMPEYIASMLEDYKGHIGVKGLRAYKTPAKPGVNITKNEGEPIDEAGFRKFIGTALFAIRKCYPCCSNAVRDLSGHLSNPSSEAWEALSHLFGYIEHCAPVFCLRGPTSLKSGGYSDSDWASDKNDRKSITSNITFIGDRGDPVAVTNWSSKKQKSIALSSCEAELYAMTEETKDILFQQSLLGEIFDTSPAAPSILYGDNTGAMFIAKNNQISTRTKHIDIRYRFMQQLTNDGTIEMRYIKSEDNPSDILSKNCSVDLHTKHAAQLCKGFIDVLPSKEGVEMNEHSSVLERSYMATIMRQPKYSSNANIVSQGSKYSTSKSNRSLAPSALSPDEEVGEDWFVVKGKSAGTRSHRKR